MSSITYQMLIVLPLRVLRKYLSFFRGILKSGETIHAQKLHQELAAILPTTFTSDGIVFDGTSKSTMIRGQTLLTKEPDTIEWLNEFLTGKDTFYDVGANIGVYSLFAARKGNHVVAIEPEASNYAILNKHIFLNNLHEHISALNIALYDQEKVSNLNIRNYAPGKSGHSFHEQVDNAYRPALPIYKQSVIGMPLDVLVDRYKLPFPNVVKIDVDGNEHKILEGMTAILGDPRLKTIAIETNYEIEGHRKMVDKLLSFGFTELHIQQIQNSQDESTCKNQFYRRRTD